MLARPRQQAPRVRRVHDQDIVQLLLVILGYCCRFDDHQQSTWALEQAKLRVSMSMYYKAHDMTNTEYVEHFKALVGVVETYGGAYGHEPGITNPDMEGITLAARGLEEPQNSQELLTESVGPVHFS